MKTTEDLFLDSIEQYNELIQKTTDLSDKMVSLSPEEILKHCEEMQELQKKQAEVDKFIIEVMTDSGPQVMESAHIDEYQRILNNALCSCDKVASKAKTIRTLLQKEIQKLKQGQKGLAGYTAMTQNTQTTIQRHY